MLNDTDHNRQTTIFIQNQEHEDSKNLINSRTKGVEMLEVRNEPQNNTSTVCSDQIICVLFRD